MCSSGFNSYNKTSASSTLSLHIANLFLCFAEEFVISLGLFSVVLLNRNNVWVGGCESVVGIFLTCILNE